MPNTDHGWEIGETTRNQKLKQVQNTRNFMQYQDINIKIQHTDKAAYQVFILYALSRWIFLTRFNTSPICSVASSKFVTRT